MSDTFGKWEKHILAKKNESKGVKQIILLMNTRRVFQTEYFKQRRRMKLPHFSFMATQSQYEVLTKLKPY